MEELDVPVINLSLGDSFFFFSLSFQNCILYLAYLVLTGTEIFLKCFWERVCLLVKSAKVRLPGS